MTSVQSFLDTLGPEIEDAEEGKLEDLFPTVHEGHGCGGGNRGICFVQLDFPTFHNLG
jgi:acyl-coenzyme A thioesterase PaaI-like protein